MAKKWIQATHMKKGALHRQLGVPQGEKIPAKKMAAARAGKYGSKAKKRANFAKTLKSFEHGGVVPGVGPVPIMAHGGEKILPAVSDSYRGEEPTEGLVSHASEAAEHRANRRSYFARRASGRRAPGQ